MENKIDFMKLYERIYSVLPSGNIQKLMDVCYEETGVPILCVDIAYNLKGAAPREPIGEYMWDYLVENHGYDMDQVSVLYDNEIIQSVDKYKAPYITKWGYWEDKPIVQGIVKVNNVLEGYVSFNCIHNEITDDLIKAMEIIQDVCSYFFKRNDSESNLSSTFEKLFAKELFNGNIKTEKRLKKWLVDMNSEFQPPYRVYVISANETKEKSTLSFLRKYLQEMYSRQIMLIQQDVLYGLSYAVSESLESNTKRTVAQLKKVNGKCGVSEEFDNLLDLVDYQKQAEMALAIGTELHPKKSLYYYHEYALPCILLPRYRQMAEVNYVPQVLQKIRSYDKENGTEFEETLRCYVRNIKNTKETAEELHIHRNTLLYRLNKIEEIFDVDFGDIQMFLHLMLSLYIDILTTEK